MSVVSLLPDSFTAFEKRHPKCALTMGVTAMTASFAAGIFMGVALVKWGKPTQKTMAIPLPAMVGIASVVLLTIYLAGSALLLARVARERQEEFTVAVREVCNLSRNAIINGV